MPFAASALSRSYDTAAATLLDEAIYLHGRRLYRRRAGGVVTSRRGEKREAGGFRLSVTERAFQRALYRNPRISQGNARKPDARYSLPQPEWGPVLPGGRREVRIRVVSDTSGARFTRRQPRDEKYVENPGLRSGYVGQG